MSWRTFLPSRTLNQTKISLYGLDLSDFFGLIVITSILQPLCEMFLEVSAIWAFGSAAIAAVILARIRSTYRRHIIRDYLQYLWVSILWNGVKHEARNIGSHKNRRV